MKTREDCLSPKEENGDRNRKKLVTCKTFPEFVEAMDKYWQDNGYQNRTRFIFSLVARRIKYKKDF